MIHYIYRYGGFMKRKEIAGQVFGRYTVIKFAEKSKNGTSKWLCRCDCGNEKIVFSTALLSGKSKSCGCLASEMAGDRLKTHGHTSGKRSLTFISWDRMRARCNKNNKYYGARGISYCEQWESFENFLSDMGERPKGKTLDRIDYDGDYSPENCRWSTAKEQANNRTNNCIVEYKGCKITLGQLCDELNLNYQLVYKRLNKGWDLQTAITKPSQKRKK